MTIIVKCHLVTLIDLLGEAVCRPVAGSIIFELFSPSARGLANGIFSWGVYYGYGLAFVIGIYMTELDILGHSWRSVYVICALPGVVVGILIAIFMRDPKYNAYQPAETSVSKNHFIAFEFFGCFWFDFCCFFVALDLISLDK